MVEYNQKDRIVRCPRCKEEKTTKELNPMCWKCKQSMITVIPSMLSDREREKK